MDCVPEDDTDDRSFTESEKNLHKRIWETSNTEQLIKSWGEKAGGLRWMHIKSAEMWRLKDERFNLANVLLSCMTAATSFLGSSQKTSVVPGEYLMIFVGFAGLVNIITLSMSQYYGASQKATLHETASKQYGNFNRFVATKLSLSRKERGDPREVMRYALKENERLHNENLDPEPESVNMYRDFVCCESTDCSATKNFVMPDILNSSFAITTYRDKTSMDLNEKQLEVKTV